MGLTFCIDESGNTGTNWIDDTQRYFIHGGWLVRDDYISKINSYFYSIMENKQYHELKSKNLFRTQKGRILAYQIIENLLLEYQAIPLFIIMDKRFMISAKIVETFFDPEYNQFVPQKFSYPIQEKRSLAKIFLQNDSTLTEFSNLIRNCTISIDAMSKINSKLIEICRINKLKSIESYLTNLTEDNYKKMINEYECFINHGNKKNRLTLFNTSIYSLLNSVEMICELLNEKATVIHDNLRGYDSVFTEMQNMLLKDNISNKINFHDNYYFFNLSHIKSIDMSDSKNDKLIQAADLLCGFISHEWIPNLEDHNRPSEIKECTIINQIFLELETKLLNKNIRIFDYYGNKLI